MKINSINGVNNVKSVQNNTATETKKGIPAQNQMTSISNVCYKPVSFGRTWAEHKSWGAMIDPETKETSFKLLTYPDSKRVTVTVQKRNDKTKKHTFELENRGNGIFETAQKLTPEQAAHGDKYLFTIYKGNGSVDSVKDPYAFRQEAISGFSTLYDHSQYEWTDEEWFTSNPDRISRKANKQNNLTPVDSAKIYELNIASFTKKGTFDAAKAKLQAIKDAGFNAIEIMPVENTFSFNWGYDGVDKLAPSEHLGGPDGLKNLIDYAHDTGLNVIMDIVPNHVGPDGSTMLQAGPYIKGDNAFGSSLNYEGKDSRYVRDYMVNAALNWLDNYHCDGLRFDMTKFMESDYTMKQIAAEINYHKPDAFIIAEDSRSNVGVNEDGSYYTNHDEPHDKRVTNPLKQFETGEGQSEDVHCQAIEQISSDNTSLGRLGYDSEWDFNYFHTLKDCLYGNINLDALEKASYCAQDRVKYVMSHDEIGNFEGSRLIAKLLAPMLHLSDNVLLSAEDISRAKEYSRLKGTSPEEALNVITQQKAQFNAEKLAVLLQTGQLDKYNTEGITNKRWINTVDKAFRDEVLKPLGIKQNSGITYDIIRTMYNRSYDQNKMALARTYSIPGPKMVFQGDERADLTPFRFFRQFSSQKDEPNLYFEKGYSTGIAALKESTFGNIRYSSSGRNMMNKYRNLTRSLNLITDNNPALTRGKLIAENTVKHPASQVFATHARDAESGNEIFSITNFNDADYPRYNAADYYIKFPEGKWVEILNTDDRQYGGTGRYMNFQQFKSDGKNNTSIKIAGQSTILFKRVG